MTAAIACADSTIEFAEPDAIVRPAQSAPNDPLFFQQWGLFDGTAGIDAPSAWLYSTGTGAVVAIIDTGYRPHVDLVSNVLNGFDFISDPANTYDGDGRDSSALDPGDWRTAGQCASPYDNARYSTWHGTHVAGIAVAPFNNYMGIAGVAPAAKALPVRVLGTCMGYTSDVADGIVWASGGSVPGVPANGTPARILNMSLYGSGSCPSTMQAAINGARSRGAAVVVAAGNKNQDAAGYLPGNCYGVITIASIDQYGGKASDSNYGSVVAIAAPGVYIKSTFNSGMTIPGSDTYEYMSGTSMAAPHVSGTAALMVAVNPWLTPDDLAIVMKGTARAFPAACNGCGAGIVNAAAAVNAVRPGAPLGTFATVYGNRNSSTSYVIVSNNGPGWITGIQASCLDSGAYITTPPPSALGPGKTMMVYAAVSPSTYKCNYRFQGYSAANAPYIVNLF